MDNTLGMIKATEPDPDAKDGADTSLPDPTKTARLVMAGLFLLALALAWFINWMEWTGTPFAPAMVGAANFALFAGFYVAAQVIERLMEFASPLIPWWKMPAIADPAAKVAQIKADRAKGALGLAAVLGVLASGFLGLYFLTAIGMDVSRTLDTFFTGITIAAGTKPLHDFTTLLQNKNSPTTGSQA